MYRLNNKNYKKKLSFLLKEIIPYQTSMVKKKY